MKAPLTSAALLLMVGSFMPVSSAAVLAQYANALTNTNASNTITTQDKTANAFATNLTAGNLNLVNTGGTVRVRFGGATEDYAPDVNGSKNLPATGWFVFNQNQSGFTGAQTNANATTYMGMTLSATEGYRFNIDGFSYIWNAGVNSITSTINYYSNVYYAVMAARHSRSFLPRTIHLP